MANGIVVEADADNVRVVDHSLRLYPSLPTRANKALTNVMCSRSVFSSSFCLPNPLSTVAKPSAGPVLACYFEILAYVNHMLRTLQS